MLKMANFMLNIFHNKIYFLLEKDVLFIWISSRFVFINIVWEICFYDESFKNDPETQVLRAS